MIRKQNIGFMLLSNDNWSIYAHLIGNINWFNSHKNRNRCQSLELAVLFEITKAPFRMEISHFKVSSGVWNASS